MWHGEDYLSEAIKLLDEENRDGFNDFVNQNISFNPHNMFICKSKNLLKKYYSVVFAWLKKCEGLFGFDWADTFAGGAAGILGGQNAGRILEGG